MDLPAWQKSLGWDESQSRRTQLITGSIGLVLLFIGVIMQWWAGNNISDISLSTFCMSYSGDDRVIDDLDWKRMKMAYYDKSNTDRDGPLSLGKMAKKFFGGTGSQKDLENIIYSDPSFWCKALPKCPEGAACDGLGDMVTSAGSTKEHGVWPGRYVSNEKHWNLAPGAFSDASSHIRCWDKFVVFREMLREVLTEPIPAGQSAPKEPLWVVDDVSGMKWGEDAIDSAAWNVLYTCYSSKGATGYILGLSPFLSSLACIFCVVSMFTCCPRSYSSSLGRGLALMAFAFSFIGFWVISFRSTTEFVDQYMYCGSSSWPLTTASGMYFDGTPCLDRTSTGENELNPFLSWSAWMTGVYTFGGIFNILATLILLVTIAKNLESEQLRKFATLTPSDDL